MDAPARAELERLAEQEAALRRLAMLVAQESSTEEIFHAVTEEAAGVLETEAVGMLRFEADGSATLVAQSRTPWDPPPLGTRLTLDGENVVTLALRTGRAARVDDWATSTGSIAAMADALRVRSCVATPIVVEGQLWGMMIAATSQSEPLPGDTEFRTTQFTELVATAISNAESRDAHARLADEQAALRRVATLVAGGVPPMEVFAAVTEEVGRLFSGDWTYVTRFDSDDAVTVLAGWMPTGEPPVQLPGRWTVGPTSEAIRAARAPVRLDPYPRRDEVEDPETAVVAAPITVEGALWGFITVASIDAERPPPSDTEARLSSFTELVAAAIANAESRAALGVLVDEQAALRRVAVLVAQQPSPGEVFTAVTEVVAPLLGADLTAMHMFTDDETAIVIAGWSGNGPMLRLGTRLPLDGDSAAARIFQTGAAARIDTYVDVAGEAADVARGLGLRSTVGAPILVEGRLWGALMAATRGEEPLPEDAETRIAEFTELVATAVSNAESRAALGLLADEQASLRRVATLVARGVPSEALFAAVTREVARVFARAEPSVLATVIRFDPGPECVMVGASRSYPSEAVGDRWMPRDLYVSTRVLRTGASARIDQADLESVGGPDAVALRARGFLHQVGSPVMVEGRLWGAMTLNSQNGLSSDVDQRLMEFTELLATAIANAESQSELRASRSRIVAAADDARRRIERDLHDGIQQQLVSIGMELGAVEASLPEGAELRAQVSAVSEGLRSAIDDLREISRGIHPAILAHGGLGPALKTLARRSPVPVKLTSTLEGRLPERVEVAAYYVVSEALTNVARHAGASAVVIDVAPQDGWLELSIRDDGVGGVDPRNGTGLIGLKDRVESLGGRIDVEGSPGQGTSLVVELPLVSGVQSEP